MIGTGLRPRQLSQGRKLKGQETRKSIRKDIKGACDCNRNRAGENESPGRVI